MACAARGGACPSGTPGAALIETLSQHGHEIHDLVGSLRVLLLRLFDARALVAHALLDDLGKFRAELVAILLRLPLPGHRFAQLPGHVDFALAELVVAE